MDKILLYIFLGIISFRMLELIFNSKIIHAILIYLLLGLLIWFTTLILEKKAKFWKTLVAWYPALLNKRVLHWVWN